VWVVVLAGGSGQRFGSVKQFADLAGRRVVDWSVAVARSVADGVVLVLPASDVPDEALPGVVVVPGGDTRASSVRAGLAAVPLSAEVVVVHDAARPLATAELFQSVIDVVRDEEHPVDGVVPALPVSDTVKRVVDHRVVATLSRHDLVAVQTPQAFRATVLRRAHAEGGEATDDAALIEAIGATIGVVPGDPANMKLTTATDLAVATALVSL
jgi:2-C-methyl-D-erythritol 4-phosphate cytidylyltransferase